ncbi:hypothetical protein IAU59_001020 [Kwoniella sp. CBS 9459]
MSKRIDLDLEERAPLIVIDHPEEEGRDPALADSTPTLPLPTSSTSEAADGSSLPQPADQSPFATQTSPKAGTSPTEEVARMIIESKETFLPYIPALLMVLVFAAMAIGSKFSKLADVTQEVKELKEAVGGMRDELRLLREVLERKL